jgi:WD40 repeat protein
MRYDVFLSHNRRDAEVVEGIARRLQRAGMRPWLDRWELAAGVEWQAALAEGLAGSSSCAVFIGPHHLGSWEQQEVNVAVDRAAKDPAFLVFLVLLPGVPEPFDPAALSPFLSMRTWVDLRGGWDGDHAFQPLVNAVKGIPIGPPSTRRDGDGVAPYRGLQVFEEQHAHDFFGREADVQRLLELLKGARFVAVVGASGSGKSSLVRAGLVPALRAGALPGSERWEVQLLKPGARPLVTLAASLLTLADSGVMQETVARLRDDPESLDMAVSLALAEGRERDRVLWVIDQAEELFTLCRDDEERQLFLENLLYAASVPGGSNAVVLTVRGDFYAMFGRYPPVAQAIATHQVLVGPMGPESLRQAIEEPARRAGVDFEDGLVTTILQDVGGDAGALPLLQEALLELWQRRRGRLLTLEAYQEAGRVEGAIAQRAEAVLAALTAEQQEVARRVLLRLTQPGEGTEDTRRRAPLRELREDDSHGDATEDVVAAFVEARMLVASADPATGEPWVEVSHEALIRGWPRLRDWIDKGRAGLRVHRRLTEAADDWERSGREEVMLYQGFRLAEAAEWLEGDPGAANEREREFVAAGLGARDRAAKRRRRRLAVAAAALILGIVLSGGAALIAIHQRNSADRERGIAKSRELASTALDEVPRNPRLSLQLAVRAAHEARTDAAKGALRAALLQPQPQLSVERAGGVSATGFSPDGRLVLTISSGSPIRLWDTRTGRRRADLGEIGDEFLVAAAFSPSGRMIATANARAVTIRSGVGKLVERFSLRKPDPFFPFPPVTPISDTPFSPDERHLVVAPGRLPAAVYDLATRTRHVLPGSLGAVYGSFSPDARLVAASDSRARSTSGATRLWRVTTPRPAVVIRGDSPVFSPDARRLLTFGIGRIFLSAVPSGDLLATARAPADTAAFGRDGRLVLIETPRGFRAISAKDGRGAPLPRGGVRPIGEPSFSPDGRFTIDFAQKLRSTITGEAVAEYPARRWPGSSRGAFSPDGRRLVTADEHGAHVWAIPAWDAIRMGRGAGRTIAVGAGPQAWSAIAMKGARSAQVLHGRLLPVGAGAAASSPVLFGVKAVGLSHDGAVAAVVREDLRLEVWRIMPRRRITSSRINSLPDSPQSPLAVSDDGHVVAAIAGRDLVAWDARTGHRLPVRTSETAGKRYRAVFSSDGRMLATTGALGAKIWETRTGRLIATQSDGSTDVDPSAFSEDGRRLLVLAGNGIARVLESGSGKTIAVVRGRGANTLSSADLSDDGNFVTAVESDGSVATWEADTGRAVAQLPLKAKGATVAFGAGNTVVTAGRGTVHTVTCELCTSFDGLLRLASTRLAGPSK